MNIQPVKSESAPVPVRVKGQPSKTVDASAAEEVLRSGGHEELLGALLSEPDVRPAEVERATALANDPGYPGTDLLLKLAEMFVNDATRHR